uniref:riboflavin kinase n=1 Tax=Oryza barthii TaxID=65489 RepID=A0A0D3HC46_9ORYZ
MATPEPIARLISHVILDLDGTLLNTDCVVSQVLKPFLVKNGKKWDSKKAHKLVGKTPYEAAAVVLEDYGLPYSTEEFLSMLTPMFNEQWCNIKALPGANRLIKHLKSNGVPAALASNSPGSNIEAKISCHQGWKESFSAIVGGDEVEKGKPSPDMPGVAAGKAAGMHVIAVPSVPKRTAEFSSADEVINSLLDVMPEKWGLRPFSDWIDDTLPIEPWFIGGPVIKGFGRGSKVLGIPTANLPAENFSDVLSEHTSGVYFGWAGLSTRGIYKMVMSIGWNPYFDNTEKTIEPWLLHDFGEDFYGEELRLVIVGYIRPEANFPSLESLIERIHEDARIAEKALNLPLYAKYTDSPYLRNSLKEDNSANGNQSVIDSK